MKLSQISIYPIKSTKGIALRQSLVMREGLGYDRRWIIADESGVALTAREYPKLVQIESSLHSQSLELTAPAMASIHLSFSQSKERVKELTLFNKYLLQGGEIDHEINEWLSEYLGTDCELFVMSSDIHRSIKEHPENRVSYADASPILLVSAASIEDLNSKLKRPVSASNFRPNLVINDSEPYQEDGWKTIQIGDCIFDMHKHCKRCIFTTLDQNTLEFDSMQEPMRTLSTYRRSDSGGVTMGVYMIPRNEGEINLNDEIQVLE